MTPRTTPNLTRTADAPTAPTATHAALALVRDTDATPADLARAFGQSETWAAGLVHAVCGDDDFAFTASIDGYDPSPAEMDDYQTGFRFGIELMEREAMAEGWAEAAEPLPVCGDDIPF